MNTIWAIFRFVALLAALLFPQLASAGQLAPKAETRIKAIDIVVKTSLKATSLREAETRSAEAKFALEIASRSPIGARGGAGLGDATTSPWLADSRVGVVSHLERFREGGSWVMTRRQYDWFVKGKTKIGDPAGQYITTRAHMDDVFARAGGDLGAIEKSLGFDAGHFSSGGGLVRVDVKNPLLHNARMPSGLERGANYHFRWGGYTSGGAPEAVIGSFDVSDAVVQMLK